MLQASSSTTAQRSEFTDCNRVQPSRFSGTAIRFTSVLPSKWSVPNSAGLCTPRADCGLFERFSCLPDSFTGSKSSQGESGIFQLKLQSVRRLRETLAYMKAGTEVNLRSTAQRVLMKSSFGIQSTTASSTRLGYRSCVCTCYAEVRDLHSLLLGRGKSGLARGMEVD